MIGILANIASFILAIYLSIRKKPWKFQAIIWAITIFITIGNIYTWVKEQGIEPPYVDIIAPHITSLEAFDMVKSSFRKELQDYNLIDIVGSYYICLKKPDLIFYRFPEWLFLFRHKFSNNFFEFKVSDSRIPVPPRIGSGLDSIKDGQIAYYIVSKEDYDVHGIRVGPNSEINYLLDIIDEEGRTLISMQGQGPKDYISETTDGINSLVLARVQIIGRPSDDISEWREIEIPHRMGKIIVKKAEFKGNQFYDSLTPITNWKIDAEEAIQISVKEGAKGTPPGKERVGGPGVFRLYNGIRYNLKGAYWDIPYKIVIRPVLIDASTGQLYAINNKGEYSTKWEKSFDIDIPSKQVQKPDSEEVIGSERSRSVGAQETLQSYSGQKVKEITELTSEELEVASGICQKVLKAYFGDRAIAWYSSTYHYLPTSDDDIVLDFSKMKKLTEPITVISVTGVALSYRFDEIKRELKREVDKLEASYHGKRYHIVRSLVLIEPGGGGGALGTSYDKVTIIPYTVAIY